MWVKKCSVLYLTSQNRGFFFLSFSHPRLLGSSLLSRSLSPSLSFLWSFSTNLHLSALLPLQVLLLCPPPPAETDPTGQIVRKSRDTQNMAVAGCPDYFLHHPNYQVNGSFLEFLLTSKLEYFSHSSDSLCRDWMTPFKMLPRPVCKTQLWYQDYCYNIV